MGISVFRFQLAALERSPKYGHVKIVFGRIISSGDIHTQVIPGKVLSIVQE